MPLCGESSPGGEAHDRALPRPVGTEQGHPLAALDDEVEVFQERLLSVIVGVAHVLHLEHDAPGPRGLPAEVEPDVLRGASRVLLSSPSCRGASACSWPGWPCSPWPCSSRRSALAAPCARRWPWLCGRVAPRGPSSRSRTCCSCRGSGGDGRLRAPGSNRLRRRGSSGRGRRRGRRSWHPCTKFSSHSMARRSRWLVGSSSRIRSGSSSSKRASAMRLCSPPENEPTGRFQSSGAKPSEERVEAALRAVLVAAVPLELALEPAIAFHERVRRVFGEACAKLLQLLLAGHQGLEGGDDLLLYREGAPLSSIKFLGRHSDLRAARMLDRAPVGFRVSGQNLQQGRLALRRCARPARSSPLPRPRAWRRRGPSGLRHGTLRCLLRQSPS